MKHHLEIRDEALARRAGPFVSIGHYFLFVGRGANRRRDDAKTRRDADRFSRLLAKEGKTRRGGPEVLPLMDAPVITHGIQITPADRRVDPIACVVADRDLYKAEDDVANLLCAFPAAPEAPVRLVIEQDGQPLTERDLAVDKTGLCLETLAAMMPGSYAAQLMVGDRRVGLPARFSAAVYSLAPLSGRLIHHAIDRATRRLSFELSVESYQVPYAGKLKVTLVDGGREVKRTKVLADAPGHYRGTIKLKGDGPFRLRLSATDDPERIAELAIPGSRAAERALTVIGELGQERLFSMLPEPEALPLRGGFLSKGATIETPLRVDDVLCEHRRVHVTRDATALTAVSLDLTRGTLHADVLGDIKAGETVEIPAHGPMTTVFLGAYFDDDPFEGYTTFATPATRSLQLDVPERARPGEDLAIHLKLRDPAKAAGAADSDTHTKSQVGLARGAAGGPYRSPGTAEHASAIPVLLSVRDSRLTASDPPDVALGAAAKRAIDAAIADISQEGLTPLDDALRERILTSYDEETILPLMYSMTESPFDRSAEIDMDGDFGMAGAPRALSEGATISDAPTGSLPPPQVPLLGGRATVKSSSHFAVRRRAIAADGTKASPALSPETDTDTEALPPPPSRTEAPEQLFYGLITLHQGSAQVDIPLPESLATFAVEAFCLLQGDWQRATASVIVDQPVRADLELPPAIQPGDDVLGRLRVAAGSGRLRVRLDRDGVPVPLFIQASGAKGEAISPEAVLESPAMLTFAAEAGHYLAVVEDADSGEADRVECDVTVPGVIRTMSREIGLLQRGDVITLDSADALTLRILPGLDEPFGMLVRATADYAHLCCEQTAAKVLSAVFMFLTTNKEHERRYAEKIILAGIARERSMRAPGRGFFMYPKETYVSEHYSKLAVRYLWPLRKLATVSGFSPCLARAAQEGIALADAAAKNHRMEAAPQQPKTAAEAYASATVPGGNPNAARAFVDKHVVFEGPKISLRHKRGVVAGRADLAYAAATLIALHDIPRGLRIANIVTRQFNNQGALYSTVDSAAAIALMIELRAAKVLAGGSGKVKVNGEIMTVLEAIDRSDTVESVEVLEGVAAVEVSRVREERWSDLGKSIAMKVDLREKRKKRVKRVAPGDRITLRVHLEKGYEPGDLVHVMLPAALSRIEGGAKVKRFSVDLEGKSTLEVPLVVTSEVPGEQHFAVCVRNMFEEERAESPGLLTIRGRSS